jgi:transcriptional antiterminator NusG
LTEEIPQAVVAHAEQPTEESAERASFEQPTQEYSEQTSFEQPAEEPEEQASFEQHAEPATVKEPEVQPSKQPPKPSEGETKSHLFAIRTTGGQEKVVLNLLQNKVKTKNINIQSVLLIENLKGYVVIEAVDVNQAFNAIQGVRHIRGQLRGELEFKDIEGYLVKKSTVSELAVDKVVEIIGGPFKGMKATITRVDHDKEEATVILLDAPYQLPVTVDANYLKLSTA